MISSLALRPVAVQRQFADCPRVLLISGAVLGAAAARAAVDVAGCELPRFETAAGLLRAADQNEVPLILSVGSFFQSGAASRLAPQISRALVGAADAARFKPPLALSTVVDAAQRDIDVDTSLPTLLTLMDAGFTSFAFPAPANRAELDLSVPLMLEVQEKGLGVELIEVPPGGVQAVLQICARLGVDVYAAREQGAHRACWVVNGDAVPEQVSARIDLPAAVLERIISSSLDVDRDEVAFAPIDAHSALRIEALSYTEFSLLLRRAGLRGGARDCVDSLTVDLV